MSSRSRIRTGSRPRGRHDPRRVSKHRDAARRGCCVVIPGTSAQQRERASPQSNRTTVRLGTADTITHLPRPEVLARRLGNAARQVHAPRAVLHGYRLCSADFPVTSIRLPTTLDRFSKDDFQRLGSDGQWLAAHADQQYVSLDTRSSPKHLSRDASWRRATDMLQSIDHAGHAPNGHFVARGICSGQAWAQCGPQSKTPTRWWALLLRFSPRL